VKKLTVNAKLVEQWHKQNKIDGHRSKAALPHPVVESVLLQCASRFGNSLFVLDLIRNFLVIFFI